MGHYLAGKIIQCKSLLGYEVLRLGVNDEMTSNNNLYRPTSKKSVLFKNSIACRLL